jgi:hypothetical protein
LGRVLTREIVYRSLLRISIPHYFATIEDNRYHRHRLQGCLSNLPRKKQKEASAIISTWGMTRKNWVHASAILGFYYLYNPKERQNRLREALYKKKVDR